MALQILQSSADHGTLEAAGFSIVMRGTTEEPPQIHSIQEVAERVSGNSTGAFWELRRIVRGPVQTKESPEDTNGHGKELLREPPRKAEPIPSSTRTKPRISRPKVIVEPPPENNGSENNELSIGQRITIDDSHLAAFLMPSPSGKRRHLTIPQMAMVVDFIERMKTECPTGAFSDFIRKYNLQWQTIKKWVDKIQDLRAGGIDPMTITSDRSSENEEEDVEP